MKTEYELITDTLTILNNQTNYCGRNKDIECEKAKKEYCETNCDPENCFSCGKPQLLTLAVILPITP